jgi:hypothetical protein
LLAARSALLEEATRRVKDELGLDLTSRVKNTGTILEKLRRQGGWSLGSMQDVAGMRIVGDFDRHGQDAVVDDLVRVFSDAGRTPKVIDRRVAPMHGYRAVHVIVFSGGAPLEIQVRTPWQHEWAEIFEKLADLVGRGIRYGEAPVLDSYVEVRGSALEDLTARTVEGLLDLSDLLDSVERRSADDETLVEAASVMLRAHRVLVDGLERLLTPRDTL